jgi:hypothetical protein
MRTSVEPAIEPPASPRPDMDRREAPSRSCVDAWRSSADHPPTAGRFGVDIADIDGAGRAESEVSSWRRALRDRD